ncbi:DUF6350 family protein [Corynebacterium mayonis]|uniref:cell division protein PerM n=1 Tax=Corynebacterium mayonis TaxID=3062461 RepID=UPI003140A30C
MSSNSNHRPPKTSKTRPVRGRVSATARRKEEPRTPETWGQRIRHYLPVAGVPHAIIALLVVLVCLATILLTGSRMSYLPGTIGVSWLILSGVPARFDGITIGIVPLLLPVAVVLLIAARVRAATKKRVSVADLVTIGGLLAGFSLVGSGVALFMVADAATVFALGVPPVAAVFLMPLLMSFLGMVLGMGPTLWRAVARRYGVAEFVVDDAVVALRAVVFALGGATVVYAGLLIASVERLRELLAEFPVLSTPGLINLLLLSLAYVPNAAVEMLGLMLGGAMGMAGGSVSLFVIDAVAVPPLPLLAALPGQVAAWAPVLMIVPAVIFAYVLRHTPSLIDATVTAAWTALACLVLSFCAGGAVGAYGYVGVNPLIYAGLAFVWALLVGVLAHLVARLRSPKSES